MASDTRTQDGQADRGVNPPASHESLEAYFAARVDKTVRKTRPTSPETMGRKLLSLLLTFAITLAVVLLVRQFVVQHNTVVGSSMAPTLENQDGIFVEKLSRLFSSGLKRGDIVTANARGGNAGHKQKDYVIKRIVGLPGEEVSIREGRVWINGEVLDETYLPNWVLTESRTEAYANLVLGPEDYYLLGDNRSASRDSRDVGPFKRQDIVGCLILRFYPFERIGKPR